MSIHICLAVYLSIYLNTFSYIYIYKYKIEPCVLGLCRLQRRCGTVPGLLLKLSQYIYTYMSVYLPLYTYISICIYVYIPYIYNMVAHSEFAGCSAGAVPSLACFSHSLYKCMSIHICLAVYLSIYLNTFSYIYIYKYKIEPCVLGLCRLQRRCGTVPGLLLKLSQYIYTYVSVYLPLYIYISICIYVYIPYIYNMVAHSDFAGCSAGAVPSLACFSHSP